MQSLETPTPPWTRGGWTERTVGDQRPLTEITGTQSIIENGQAMTAYPSDESVTHYVVTCRACGSVEDLSTPQTLQQAGVLRDRHLSEHLALLAAEIMEAAR